MDPLLRTRRLGFLPFGGDVCGATGVWGSALSRSNAVRPGEAEIPHSGPGWFHVRSQEARMYSVVTTGRKTRHHQGKRT